MNDFWKVLKALEGRTVAEVRENVYQDEVYDETVSNGFVVECTDGYTVVVSVDYEDVELAAEARKYSGVTKVD